MATDQMQGRPASIPKYEAVFEQQLGRTVGRIRFLDVAAALLGLAAATLLYALIVIALDRWLVLSSAARQTALVLYLLAALAYLGFFLVRPMFRPVNPYFAAKRLEATLSQAKNSVVNWLDLRGEPLPAAIRTAVGQRAAQDASRAHVDEAVSGRRAAWAGSATGLLFVVLLVTLAVLGPSQFWSLLGRAFGPFSAGSIRTRTQIELRQPQGDAVVPVGRSVPFAASITGKVPAANRPDAPRLLFRYRQTDPYEERPLQHDRDSEWVGNLPANQVHNGFWYKIAAGDAETDEYQVRVRSTPLVEKFDVTYHYRPYLGWKDEISTEPNLKALVGTEVVLIAHTNRAIREGTCVITSKGHEDKVLGERVPGDANALRFKFVIERSGQYRIGFTSTESETNPDQLPYSIEALLDRPPEVALKKPGKDITLPANGLLQLEGSASDDLGVERMTLRMRVADQTLKPKPYRDGKSFKLADGGYPKMLAYKDAVELDKVKDEEGKPFALKPKMEMEYWLEAADACDYPRPNIGESAHHKVIISEPDQNQQKQQQNRQEAQKEQQQHEQQQDQQLAKENEQRQQGDQQNQNQEQQGNNEDKGAEQQPGQQGGDNQPDPKTQQTEKKLENALQDKDNQNKSDSKPPDEGDSRSEPKEGSPGQGQPKPGERKTNGQDDNKDGSGIVEGKPEPGQNKDEGAKPDPQSGQPGEDKKPGEGGKNQDQSASKPGAGDNQPHPGEPKNSGEQEGAQKNNGSGKDSGQNANKPEVGQPKGPGDNKADQNQGEGKRQGQTGAKDQPPGNTKPDDKQATPGQIKDPTKDELKNAQPKGPEGSGEKAGNKTQGTQKPGTDKTPPGEGKDNAKPKPGTKPNAGQQGGKPGENAKPEDIAKLAEQMKKEKGKGQDDTAKQLSQAARNAKDNTAREQARQALEQAERDPQTGEPTPATSKNGPPNQGAQPQDGNGTGEPKNQPGKKGEQQTSDAKTGDGGQDEGKKSERKDGGNSEGSGGAGSGTDESKEQSPTGPARGKDRTGRNPTPGHGVGGGEQGFKRGDAEPPNLQGAPPNDGDRLRKGELLLERFDKLLAKEKQKFLEDAQISDEDMQRLRNDLARRKARQAEKPEPSPRATGRGSRTDRGAARVQGQGKPRAADTQYGGPGSPPPELRDIYHEFTKGQEKK
jgi:hypothetical protein